MDQLFVLRDTIEHLRPFYDDTLVQVALDDSALERLENLYLNRWQHAQVVRNLTAMRVAAQMHDFIFATRANDKDDQALIGAPAAAGPIYYGLALTLESAIHGTSLGRLEPEQGEKDHKLPNKVSI